MRAFLGLTFYLLGGPISYRRFSNWVIRMTRFTAWVKSHKNWAHYKGDLLVALEGLKGAGNFSSAYGNRFPIYINRGINNNKGRNSIEGQLIINGGPFSSTLKDLHKWYMDGITSGGPNSHHLFFMDFLMEDGKEDELIQRFRQIINNRYSSPARGVSTTYRTWDNYQRFLTDISGIGFMFIMPNSYMKECSALLHLMDNHIENTNRY